MNGKGLRYLVPVSLLSMAVLVAAAFVVGFVLGTVISRLWG